MIILHQANTSFCIMYNTFDKKYNELNANMETTGG